MGKDSNNVGGQLHGISLGSFLQMSEMDKTTCTLKISSNKKYGYLYLLNGELINAEIGETEGKKAAHEIISWEPAVIEIDQTLAKKDRKINQPLISILMEGLRIKDEKNPLAEQQEASPELELELEPDEGDKLAEKDDSIGIHIEPPDVRVTDTSSDVPDAEELEETPGPPESVGEKTLPEKKRLTPILTGILSIILIAAAGTSLWITVIGPKMTMGKYKKVLEQVKQRKSLEAKAILLQDYVDSRGSDVTTALAEEKIKKIRKLIVKQDYKRAVGQVNKLPVDKEYNKKAWAIYSEFIASYPLSIYAGKIKKQLAGIPELVDDSLFKELEEIAKHDYEKRITAYSAYRKDFPEGRHTEEVNALYSQLTKEYYDYIKNESDLCEKSKEWDRCIALCKNYMTRLKDSKYINNVKKLLAYVKDSKDFSHLKTLAAQKGSDHRAARKVYTDYLRKKPRSTARESIRLEVAAIDKKIQEKREWQQLVADSRNTRIDVFERINRVENYIRGNPTGIYTKKTKKILRTLKKEKKQFIQQLREKKELELLEQERLAQIEKEMKRLAMEKKIIIKQLEQAPGRFAEYGEGGIIIDRNTGRMWCMLDSNAELSHCVDYKSSKRYVASLTTGGHYDWRLPTANELVGIYKNEPYFPDSGTKWYWTSEVFWKGVNEIASVVTTKRENVWKRENAGLNECGTVRAIRP